MSRPRPSDDAPFRRDTKTVEDARAEGFHTGINWSSNWTPGGPWVYPMDRHAHPDLVAYATLSKARHTAWMEGFHSGRKLAS